MDMWQDISYLLMHSTRMEEKILGDDYKAVNALAKGRKIRNFERDHLRYIHTPRPAPRSRETRFEKRRPAKVPEPQPFEESLRFLGLGRERAQFLGGVVAGWGQEVVDQSHRKADISSLAGVGALRGIGSANRVLVFSHVLPVDIDVGAVYLL